MMISVRRFATAALAAGLADTPASADEAALELGKKVFLEISEPRCGLCHTLADAGTTGEVGPILDELKPDAMRVKAAVVNGIGPMPANEILTEEQIDAVALYVSSVAAETK
jgi:cytochrome c6